MKSILRRLKGMAGLATRRRTRLAALSAVLATMAITFLGPTTPAFAGTYDSQITICLKGYPNIPKFKAIGNSSTHGDGYITDYVALSDFRNEHYCGFTSGVYFWAEQDVQINWYDSGDNYLSETYVHLETTLNPFRVNSTFYYS